MAKEKLRNNKCLKISGKHYKGCSYCHGECVKAGKQINGAQKYQCKSCKKYQLQWYSNKGCRQAVQNYTQQYEYDEVGNILNLQHIANAGSYTRLFNYNNPNNQLTSTSVGSNTYNYTYDTRGNITDMPHLQSMNWNVLNELYQITRGTVTTNYQYSQNQRIRKYTDKGSIKEERIYLGNFEIYRKYVSGTLSIERTTVHISDDTGRIAMLETRTQGTASNDNNTPKTLKRYIYSNHIQSASLELDENADIICYEEYHAFGTTSYQAMNSTINAVAKRYKYTGKERDEESGLNYHNTRYYIPWLCRWLSPDTIGIVDDINVYSYCHNNPIKYIDKEGTDGRLTVDNENKSVTLETTVFVYGNDKNINYEEYVKNANEAFAKLNPTRQVTRTLEDGTVETWNVSLKVNFKYSKEVDKMLTEKNIGDNEAVFTEDVKNLIPEFKLGDNTLRLSGSAQLGEHVMLQIINVLGELIKHSTLTTKHSQIDVSRLVKGIYFIKVGNATRKFVKE